MFPLPHRRLFCTFLAVCCLTLTVRAADWNRFRGPNGTGSVEDAEVPTTFGEQDHLLWKVPAGAGHSSPIVVGGRIYFQSAAEDGTDRRMRCLSLADGKELWWRQIAGRAAHTHPKAASPRGRQRLTTSGW